MIASNCGCDKLIYKKRIKKLNWLRLPTRPSKATAKHQSRRASRATINSSQTVRHAVKDRWSFGTCLAQPVRSDVRTNRRTSVTHTAPKVVRTLIQSVCCLYTADNLGRLRNTRRSSSVKFITNIIAWSRVQNRSSFNAGAFHCVHRTGSDMIHCCPLWMPLLTHSAAAAWLSSAEGGWMKFLWQMNFWLFPGTEQHIPSPSPLRADC
jgi:hypothetical protein